MKIIVVLITVMLLGGCNNQPKGFVSRFVTEEGVIYGPVEVPDGSDSPLITEIEKKSLTGIHYIMDPENRLWEASSFEDGLMDGFSISWHINGEVRSKWHYRKGELSERTSFYYTNGVLKAEVNYENGLRTGPVIEFFPNGLKKKVGRFEDDEPVGEWITYNEKGEVVAREVH